MALTTHISQVDKSQTPYQIDPDQTLRASQALLKHVQAEVKRVQETSQRKNLLAGDSDDDEGPNDAQPIWLTLATKQYIADKHKLKPGKIAVPHSLNTNENGTICLITGDPQRNVKNVVADPSFPSELKSRITTIIGFSKLVVRYKNFEQRRQLLREHDIFLADERILPRLPKALGKVFYKGTTKRPISISIAPKVPDEEKPTKKPPKDERQAEVAGPDVVAKEIEKALKCIPVHLSPGHNITVRIGLESFTPNQVSDNVAAVIRGIIDKHVANGWKNVRSVHIKSNTSVALPIWLADDLWLENSKTAPALETVADASETAGTEPSSNKRKRKANSIRGPQSGERKKTRLAEQQAKEKDDAAARKARLSAQKAKAFEAD